MRFELMTSSLPRRRSTPELRGPRVHACKKTLENGAGDEIRTRDPQLGRLMLYQLSYTRPTEKGKAKGEGRKVNLQLAFALRLQTFSLPVVQGGGFEPP